MLWFGWILLLKCTEAASLSVLPVLEIPSVISAGGGEESFGSNTVNSQSIVRPAHPYEAWWAVCGQVQP